MSNFVVAIDGGAGSGKSTTAKGVAKSLNFLYLDTGAMYRAFTLKYLNAVEASESSIPNSIDDRLVKELLAKTEIDLRQDNSENKVYLDGKDVTLKIRTPRISNFVSQISAIPEVREQMVKRQRQIARDKNVVCEGRDIGTVVFPDAEIKFFMTADLATRAERRKKELHEKGTQTDLDEVIENLKFRDEYDSTRKHSPLKKAQDAIIIDTTNLTINQEITIVENLIKKHISASGLTS